MAGLRITVACSPSDRSRAVMSGEVAIEGCEAELVSRPAGELLDAAGRTQTYDVTEMSMSSHLVMTARGQAPYVAVPAFHSRVFRHASIYINRAAGIARPQDLAGRRIGVQQYQQTAALWVRGMLSDEYGVSADKVMWRTGGRETPGGGERVPIKLPDRIRVEPIAPEASLSDMLVAGEIDAMIAPREPACAGAPEVGLLFPDTRRVEEDYYRRTRLFPIMHGIGIRRSIAEANPWLAGAVFAAFATARRRALDDLAATGVYRITLPWARAAYEEAAELMGPDFWPYGFAANRRELEAMARYAHEQGLADRVVDPAEMFAPSTVDA